MANVYGPSLLIPFGPGLFNDHTSLAVTSLALDATNEAVHTVGRIITSDGQSHTLDTSGSSSIRWRMQAGSVVDAGTTVKVGLAAVDTANGPAPRAVNASNVATLDVERSITGAGGGELSGVGWKTSVPTSGSKTVANGDLVAAVIQMTARGGTDTMSVGCVATPAPAHGSTVTHFTSSYTAQAVQPNMVIQFADGAYGWFFGTELASGTPSTQGVSSTTEYGNLYEFPFSGQIAGIWGVLTPSSNAANFNLVLYSDPLGTPVAERTVAVDGNTVAATLSRRIFAPFSSPYNFKPNQKLGIVVQRSAGTVNLPTVTIPSLAERIAMPGGSESYSISGTPPSAFAQHNSGLATFFLGPIFGGFEHGAGPSYGIGI